MWGEQINIISCLLSRSLLPPDLILAAIKQELEVIDGDQTQVTARIDDIKKTRQAMIKVNEQIKVVNAQIEAEKRNYKALETENASLSIEQDTTESTATLLALKEELAEIEAKREMLSKRNAVLAAASALGTQQHS